MKRNLLTLLAVTMLTAQAFGADQPTPYPTATPYPCSYPYGVTTSGKNQPSKNWVYAFPVSIGLTGKTDQVNVYASQKETVVVGLYDGGDKLLKAVTINASREGWQKADFPATVTPGLYYLAKSGTSPQVNLVADSAVSCFYDESGILGPSLHRSGSLPGALPIYLTGCPPQTFKGFLFGAGDSVMGGAEMTGGGKSYMELLNDWLNKHYGPIDRLAYGASSFDSSMMNGHIDFCFNNRTVALCVLGIGMNNLEYKGGPGSSRAALATAPSAFLSALIYGQDLQNMITTMRSHMPPGGIVLIANLYEAKDFTEHHLGEWKEYEWTLKMYNDILAMVAKANNVRIIDLYSIMASNPAYRDPKNMHPNSAGHSAIAVEMQRAIVETLNAQMTATPTTKKK